MTASSRQGFTLIEIAFALLVASIGMLGIMGLFPTGIAMNKMAHDETRAAMFAEEVLNGVRAQAAIMRWDKINTGIDLPPPTPDKWNNPDVLRIRSSTGAGYTTLRFETIGAITGSSEPYLDYAIRYNLRIVDMSALSKAVYLDIMPGEYGNTVTNRYYMELYNHGQQ